MKKVIFPVLLVLLIIVFSGCPQPPLPPAPVPPPDTSYKDCGASEECAIDALKVCEKAFAKLEEIDPEAPFAMTVDFRVHGFEGDNCKMNYKIETVKGTGNDEDAAFITMLKMMLEGKEMSCLFPRAELSTIDNLNIGDAFDKCTGGLVDVLSQVQG